MFELNRGICKSYFATIHMAGDIDQARNLIRKFTDRGACVQLAPCDYVYTRGLETGFTARILNYPRFPRRSTEILDMAIELGNFLGEELCQKSFSIETESEVHYFTHKDPKFSK